MAMPSKTLLKNLKPVPNHIQYYVPALKAWIRSEDHLRLYYHPTKVGFLIQQSSESFLSGGPDWEEVFVTTQELLKFDESKPIHHA